MVLNLGTDILLANLFQSCDQLSFGDISIFYKYLVASYLSNGTMIRSDFCEYSVRSIVKRYPTLFELSEDSENNLFVRRKAQPNLPFFMNSYNADDVNYIRRLVTNYLQNKERIAEIINPAGSSLSLNKNVKSA